VALMVNLALSMMQAMPAEPRPDDISLFEVFQRREYTEASDEEKARLQLESAAFRYRMELQADFFETYFPTIDPTDLRGRTLLDLGSFTGGRLVRWAEKYGIGDAVGIDIDPIFAEAGSRFAEQHGVPARFYTGFAENMPFRDGEFDAVVAFDVFEHVQDVGRVLDECLRILKPGGYLATAFPPYFQPAESHLGLVTRAPALQWLFSGRTLTAAYHAAIRKRGEDAYWYARESPEPEAWERSPTLNGITVRRFRQLLRARPDWRIEYWSTNPIFSGRAQRSGAFRLLKSALSIPASLPVFEELFLGRIVSVLRKKA
jgi:ubiquinone/menaquinone biosynthesis C-methylase UbiE